MTAFMRLHAWFAVIAALIVMSTPGMAQEPADSADVLVFSHSFTAGSGEFVRVFLQAGQVYRAEINLGEVSFTIRPRRPGGETPTVVLIRGGLAASNEAVYEIYPFKDDEYQIQVLDVPQGESGSLHIYRDIAASRRRQGIVKKGGGGYAFGLEVAAGFHSDYRVSQLEQTFNAKRQGSDWEGCLEFHPVGGRFWGCLFGVSRHTSDSAPTVTWFFVEPRIRLAGGTAGQRLEFGALFRGGFGSTSEDSNNPFTEPGNSTPAFLAPGAYLRYWFGRTPGKGLSIGVSIYQAFLVGTDGGSGSFNHVGGAISYLF
jgi:hypothetical protein